MSLRSRLSRLSAYFFEKVFGSQFRSGQTDQQTAQLMTNRLDHLKDTAKKFGNDLFRDLEGKRQMLARTLEKELDVKAQYQRIQAKLAQDLAELEMRKAVLEKEVSADERLLFEEAYEHARKEIIQRRMREASTIFYPNTSQKLRDELLMSFVKILKGEKQSDIPKTDEA